ncbi:MAG: hypothetical protein ACP59X_07235 [Solidesulfovibrio sp. DCME]|uniref:hypothetical protein n=1 Tax=Solidesulfovibrio sp. DCME TaxID=3447380 RepID=UPI003D0C9B2B
MKGIIEIEHKKIQLEANWRSRFNELKEMFGGDVKVNREQIMAEILSIKEKSESIQIFSLAIAIDAWLKGDRVYTKDEYITRQELERIIKNDDYYLDRNHVHESFLDKRAFETVSTPENLVDTWLLNGLPYLEACPWTPPPRYDYYNEQDCSHNPGNTRAVKVADLNKFLDEHNLPVPFAIFPNDPRNTRHTLDLISISSNNLIKVRKEQRERLEFEELCRKNGQPHQDVTACFVNSLHINKTNINNTTSAVNNHHVSTISVVGEPSGKSEGTVQEPQDHVVTGPTGNAPVAEGQNVPVAEAEAEESVNAAVTNAKPSSGRGRKPTLDDMECLRIYRQHYQEGKPIEALAKEYDWLNSPFADNPVFETAKSRINNALKRGRKLTLPHARPANDKAGRE